MDQFNGLAAFVRTADLGSFAAAGKALGLTPSAVGKAVTTLERHLGVRLFQRSTRSLRLTEEGRLFHDRCKRILDDFEDARASLAHALATPNGRLRVSVPLVSYHLLLPVIPEFIKRFPDVELDIDFNDLIVDLIDQGIDVAIRSGDLPDSRLTSRALRPFRMLLCAAPDYLAECGTPLRPKDLDHHLAIRFRYPNTGKLQPWPLRVSEFDFEMRARTVLTCNNMEALRGATESGLGIGFMPDFLARAAIAAGRLQPLLTDFLDGPGQFHLLWASNRHLSPKVRVFVDFLSERLFSSHCAIEA
ncbi:LysR family transcriptional regulator [Rhizobium laguerreae]|uniref:LysR family transcriptional regulator n=1 Tax=Rhizobium laguerreae TaxID=1076926 RepID=UPI001C9189AC|nr:LysR family transcriptional regulator [Rhizobium laguerreae]MBY3417084.1 LysR family transcriptional regulator [Rhizobium laguerreae]